MSGILLGADFADEVMGLSKDTELGFSFGKMLKKVAKATNPIRVTKNLAKATVKAIDPRTHFKIIKGIVTDPLNVKRNVGRLAMLDPGINTTVKMFRDMKDKKKKPQAVAAYKATVAQAQAGDPEARKQVGVMKQLAIAEQKAPEVPDSEMEKGAEEIVKEAHDQNPQVFKAAYVQAARAPDPVPPATPPTPYSPQAAYYQPAQPAPTRRIPQPGDPDYYTDEDFDDDFEDEDSDDEMEGDAPSPKHRHGNRGRHRGQRREAPAATKTAVQGDEYDALLGGVAKTLTSGKLDYKSIVRQNAGLDSLGFSFGDLVKSATEVVKKVAPTAVAVAKLTPYGAAIDTALKVASPALQSGVNMLRGAQKGDPVAAAKVQQVKRLAAAGSSQGQAALKTLEQAKTLNNAVVSEARKLVQQPTASLSVPSSTPGAAPVQVIVMMPNQDAVREVVSAAKNSGSRFFLPVSSSLYQEGLLNP